MELKCKFVTRIDLVILYAWYFCGPDSDLFCYDDLNLFKKELNLLCLFSKQKSAKNGNLFCPNRPILLYL